MQPKIYYLDIARKPMGDCFVSAVDPALLRCLNYTPDELTIQSLGISSKSIKLFFDNAKTSEISVQTLFLNNYAGQKIHFSVHSIMAPSLSQVETNEQECIRIFFVDTEPFVQVEAELRKNEEKYRELVENANSIILRWDRNGFITYFNEYAQRFFGYTEQEIIGQHVMDTIVPKTESTGRDLTPLMNDICENPENYESNVNENCTKDGRRVWINWTNKILKDDDDKVIGALSIGSDITRQKQMEEELRHKHKMDAIGQLAGGMAHDFNNMLQGLMGFAEILKSRLQDEQLKNYAERIITISRQSSELTGQLLAFARKGQYQLVSIDIHHEIAELILMLEHMLDKKIIIQLDMQAEVFSINGDRVQVKNSLLNLALNAKDAMLSGGTLSFISSNVIVTDELIRTDKLNIVPGHYLRLDVSDTGCGISDAIQEHIYEPFFTTKKQGEGTGMGLSAVYGTMANHGGEIVIQSQLGQGTCFSLYFPVCTQNVKIIEEKQPLIKGKGNILLVDDDEVIRTYSQVLFEQYDYNIKTCCNGLEAVEYFQKNKEPIDLVILDMIMPKMGGQETFRELKRLDPDIKVVIASGYGLDEEIQTIIDEGAIDFIQKPFTMECLSEVLKNIVSN